VQTTFRIFKMAAVAMETTKNTNNLKCLELDETFQKFCLTCVHIILRLRNFTMVAVATKNVNNLKCSELDEA
jgi:L-cystine uptake protein TcyP (sodium:dicarboxylate symporter family)